MQALLINGSPRKNGNTKHALQIVERPLAAAGIDVDWFDLGTAPVHGCLSCNWCRDKNRCVQADDACNRLIGQMLAADAIVIASPVYFAGPNGALCALLDRAFYAASNYGQLFAGKLAAPVATCWREGGSATIDRLMKYLTFSQMEVVSSDYWPVRLTGDDPYGDGVLGRLGDNLAARLSERGR